MEYQKIQKSVIDLISNGTFFDNKEIILRKLASSTPGSQT